MLPRKLPISLSEHNMLSDRDPWNPISMPDPFLVKWKKSPLLIFGKNEFNWFAYFHLIQRTQHTVSDFDLIIVLFYNPSINLGHHASHFSCCICFYTTSKASGWKDNRRKWEKKFTYACSYELNIDIFT